MDLSDRQAKTLRDLAAKFELFSEIYSRTVKDLGTKTETQERTLDRLNWAVTEMKTRVDETYRVLRGHNGASDTATRGLTDLVYDHKRRFAFQDKLLWVIITALFALALSTWWNRPTITDEQWSHVNNAIRELQGQQGKRAVPGGDGP